MPPSEREPTPGMRGFGPFSVVAAISAAALGTALLFTSIDSAFGNLAALLVFVAAVFDAVLMFREHRRGVAIGFVVVALVTNPILAFGVATFLWVIVFYAIAAYFAIVAFLIRGPGPDPDADVTPDKRFL